MLVYQDIFTGDEMLSDAYPAEFLEDGAVIAVKSSMMTVGGETIDIGANPSAEGADADEGADDGEEKVNNIIATFNLTETSLTKKEFMSYIKGYMKKVEGYLKEHAADRVEPFKKAAQSFVKKVLGDYKEYQLYMGESFDPEALLVLAKFEDEDLTPTFYYWKDGLKEVKF